MGETKENVIEWIKDNPIATVFFTQKRMKTRIRKFAKEIPEECQIVAENADGSLCAHIPVRWIKISPVRKVSEKQIENAKERIKAYHERRRSL